MDAENPQLSGWFAVRSVVEHVTDELDVPDGQRLYEERVTLWRAASVDEALELAEAEDRGYCDDAGASGVGSFYAYALTVEPGHGAEVFAQMRTSALDPDAYFARHFDTGTEQSVADE